MALNRIQFPRSLPLAESDYDQKNTLIATLAVELDKDVILSTGSIAEGFTFAVGGTVYKADSDTAVSGSQTSYIKITASGATATAEYVADISDAEWNETYNGYYDDDGNLYIVDEDAAFVDGDISQSHQRFVTKNVNTKYTGEYQGTIAGDSVDILSSDIFIGPANLVKSSFSTSLLNGPSITIDTSNGNVIVGALSGGIGTGTIYVYDYVSHALLSSFSAPGGAGNPNGLAYDSSTGNLISLNNFEQKIYVHDGISSSILTSFATPSASSITLTYNPNTGNLISGRVSGIIDYHDGVSGTVTTSSVVGGDIQGLGFDTYTGGLMSYDDDTKLISLWTGEGGSIFSTLDMSSITTKDISYYPSSDNMISFNGSAVRTHKRRLYSS